MSGGIQSVSRSWSTLAAALTLLSGCAEISTSTRSDYRAAGVERVKMDPAYEPQATARLTDAEKFEDARLLVTATRLKTCRTQTVELREKVVHTDKKIKNQGMVAAIGLLSVGSLACAGVHLSGSACLTKSAEDTDEGTGEDTDERVPLSDGERQAWGATFAVLGTAGVTAVIVDLVRATDESEVVRTDRRPTQVHTEACGVEPNGSTVVEVHVSGSDSAPYTTQTDSNGKASIALTRLALEHVEPGDSIGRVDVAGQEIEGEPFPSRWSASKHAHYERVRFEEAKASGTADAYFRYLKTFPDGAHSRKAHLQLQAIVTEHNVPELLASYLSEFGGHPLVRRRHDEFQQRLRRQQVDAAYEAYVDTWNLEQHAESVRLDDAKAVSTLNERLFEFHNDRLEQARRDEVGFQILEANYMAAMRVAPSPKLEASMRDALAGLLTERAQELGDQDGAKPGDAEVIRAFERAMDVADSDEVAAQARREFVKYIAESLRAQARQAIASGLAPEGHIEEALVERGLEVAQTSREQDIVRVGWVNACADLAEYVVTEREADEQLAWLVLIEFAKGYADSAAARKQLAHRTNQIERKLHKRFPPSKLENIEQVAVIYPPTIDHDDTSGVRRALSSPNSNRGERMVLRLDIKRAVGGNYLAETDVGQLVFIYSSNSHARSRLRTGARVAVLATIDGAIPYRREDERIHLPRLDVIWAER